MAQVIEHIDVDVPVATAYNQWTQFETFGEFPSMVESITQIDDVTTRWVVKIAGAEREFVAVISEQHPDGRIAWTSVDGEVDHAGVVTFHTLSDFSSRVTVQIDWEPKGALESFGAVVGVDSRAVKAELKHFKDFIETEGLETGAWRGDVSA